MDWGHDERDYAAGHSDRAPRLDAEAWAGMVANIRAIAELARDRHGVRAVIHPHAGGYIEFEDELDRIATDVPSETAGLCLDTGHLDYSGMDPVADASGYADRTRLHPFKDIDRHVYADVMGRRIRFFDACAEGVMCPIGRGRIDYPALRRLLTEIGYGGYITIEQERDPRNTGGILRGPRREPGLPAAHRLLKGKRDMKTLDLITIGRSSVDLYGDQVGGRLEDMGELLQVHRRLADQHRLRHGAAGAEVRGDHRRRRRAHGPLHRRAARPRGRRHPRRRRSTRSG